MLLSVSHTPHNFPSKPFPILLPSPFSLPPSHLLLKNPNPNTLHCLSSHQQSAGKSAIERISDKLRSLGYLSDDQTAASDAGGGGGGHPLTGPGSAGEIFIPTPHEIPKHRVGHTIDPSWSTPEHPVPEPGSSDTMTRFRHLWKREQESLGRDGEEVKVVTVAELTLSRNELRRLRSLGIRLTKRLKVGKAGITEGIVNGIHERWRQSEVVKIRCEDLCRMNMKRTHEVLERKTGGLVVWRSGNIIVLYRGTNYKYPYFHYREDQIEKLDEDCSKPIVNGVGDKEQGSSSASTIEANASIESSVTRVRSPFISGVGAPNKLRLQLPGETQLQDEADRLLDGLGPRFTDWWGYDPLPVDGDLLPAIVPGFRRPFRLLPFGLKPQLKDREVTILRRLSRHIPCHFTLGRNRNLQGLANSIIKLWEKCEVAKIAIKRGVQNTDSGIMAEELKKLTGGTLLSRDKDFIVLYRGKDFLPAVISIAIEERRTLNSCDGKPTNNEISPFAVNLSPSVNFTNSSSESEVKEKIEGEKSLMTTRNLKSTCSYMKKVEAKLTQANQNIQETEKNLAELGRLIEPTIIESDKEGISKEERYMLRRVGLRMKPFLLLGRRGVFDGTIENMHLHWKYRELVKIIFNERYFENVERTARTLEAESGGILVAIERVSKGYAVVIYRGKNYRRPANLRPKTLLNKKEALKHYVEAQRSESLKLHALHLSKTIDQLDYQVNNDLKMNMLLSSESEGPNSSNEIGDKVGHLKMENGNCSEPKIESNISFQSDFKGENVEEVNEINAVSFQSDNIPSDKMETFIVPNQNMVFLEHQNENHDAEIAEHRLAPIRKISMIGSERKSLDSEVDEASSPTICGNYGAPEELSINFSREGAQISGISSLENSCERESDVESIFRPAPLSNRERLHLRKQALKMRKRPVLAVGKNNILTGVAKTIKTHFRKHPLAIVNIKGTAKGISVQELVFKLEQATGSVLVSREPNKIILYRGWGEGDVRGGIKKTDVSKTPMEVNDGLVSHQLIEAIKRECGLPSDEAQ